MSGTRVTSSRRHFRAGAFVLGVFAPVLGFASVSLIEAVKTGDQAEVRTLLQKRTDINAQEFSGQTALHWAVYKGNLTIADLLIKAGANVNAKNLYGVTPLFLACENGNTEVAERLLAAGANPSQTLEDGETPLMAAARTGNESAITLLLARHVQIDAREQSKDQTALMWAAAEGHAGAIKLLVDAGADVTATTKGGFTPLLFAARNGDAESAKVLLVAGAKVNQATPTGMTPLLIASASGNESMVKFLLGKDANPNATDEIGMTPLHAATWLQRGQTEIVKALLAFGANPNGRLTKAPPRSVTEFAAFYQYLVSATPFILAAKEADVPVMQALLAGGADPLAKTADDSTALHASSGIGWTLGVTDVTFDEALEAAKFLLGVGIDPNAKNIAGQTAIYGAARNGDDPLVQYLVDKGAAVNTKDNRGHTPLYIALHAQQGASTVEQKTTAELLRKLGATE